MKKLPVVSWANMPTMLPITQMAVCALALDYYGAPLWLWCVACSFYSVVFVSCILRIFLTQSIDILEGK